MLQGQNINAMSVPSDHTNNIGSGNILSVSNNVPITQTKIFSPLNKSLIGASLSEEKILCNSINDKIQNACVTPQVYTSLRYKVKVTSSTRGLNAKSKVF